MDTSKSTSEQESANLPAASHKAPPERDITSQVALGVVLAWSCLIVFLLGVLVANLTRPGESAVGSREFDRDMAELAKKRNEDAAEIAKLAAEKKSADAWNAQLVKELRTNAIAVPPRPGGEDVAETQPLYWLYGILILAAFGAGLVMGVRFAR